MLIMTGRLPGLFEIEFWTVVDPNGNELSLPKFTALTMTTSLLSMLKACVDLNLQRIHIEVNNSFVASKPPKSSGSPDVL